MPVAMPYSVNYPAIGVQMLFELPDHKTLYTALIARDESYEGHAFVCVSTTGVFCRLSCPARKPKLENCQFYATIVECMEAGYRPCKRCKPLIPIASCEPLIAELVAALEQNPDKRWGEEHITAMGYDLSTVRRSFKRQFGITFLEMARLERLRNGFDSLASGHPVITAQHNAEFASASAFRVAFAKLLGCSPGDLRKEGTLLADWIKTPLGDMIAVSSKKHLHLLEFTERKALASELAKLRKASGNSLGLGRYAPTEQVKSELAAYFSGASAEFHTPVSVPASPFTQTVWDELRKIPPGQTRSYSELARQLDRPGAARAVARANGANQIALIIPCHRVVGADGSLTGYGGGLWRKQKLIEIEQQYS